MTTTKETNMKQLDATKVRGSLLAGACGDALGAPIEFLKWTEIRKRFGKDGIANYTGKGGYGLGAITDDTQMTLFTLEGLERSWVGDTLALQEVMVAYLAWYATQGGKVTAPRGELVKDKRLHARRAPGMTCLAALRDMAADVKVANDSKGCGGVMRSAPFGFWRATSGADGDLHVFHMAARAAWLTHKHPSGYLPAGALAVIVRGLLGGDTIPAAVNRGMVALANHAAEHPGTGHLETELALRSAITLAQNGKASPQTVEKHLGGGWTGEEALAIAVYAALRGRNLREGVQIAVNHSGDSDSTGAIAGNILGAAYGESAIPAEWLEPLECRDLIEEWAGRAVSVFQ